jgi:hypothetical protein
MFGLKSFASYSVKLIFRIMASFVFRLLGRTVGRQIRPPSKNQFSSKAFCRVVLGTSVVYTFNEEEVNRPEKPIDFPKLENLTTEFFIRQACAASSDQVPVPIKIKKLFEH